jgi:ureidoglycolate lyase
VIEIVAEPLTKPAFAPFGDVIEMEGATSISINQGFAERFGDLATVDVCDDDGTTNVSIVVANPRPMPIILQVMERHPLGSQIFVPLQERDWLVAVCTDPKDVTSYRIFHASGRQGINYRKGAWHHPLLVFDLESRFLVVDRMGPGKNLEEIWLSGVKSLRITP